MKWTLAVLGVAVVPMVALGLIVLDIQRAGLSRAEKELEAAVVDEAAGSVIAALDQAADVGGRVRNVFADETMDVDARLRAIGDVVGRTPAASGVSFFDGERRFVDAVVPKGRAIDDALRAPPDREGFRVLALPEGPRARHESRLEGAVGGFVVVGISREILDARLREISRLRFGAPDRVALVDESLALVAGDRAPKAIFAVAPRSFGAELLFTTELEEDGIAKVATIRSMPAQRWALVVERPTDEAFGALATARRALLYSALGVAALAAIASLFVVRRVLAPIGALMDLVKRYARRDFSARSDVSSGDELEALGASLERMADDLASSETEIEKRIVVESNLRRYMPEEAAEAAASAEASLDLGGAKKRVTVIFADVVAFTGFAERTSPERSVAFLNELFTILSEIVFRHDGMVDKFLGDCVMAVFRPRDPSGRDDVARALAAAEDMHAFVASNLPRWRQAYDFTVELGIGVASGEVLMGNLGSSTRMEYTVIGDAVNVAARLEALARPRQTLTTRDVVDACPGVAFTSLGEHELRGRAKPVEVFEVAP
ncbi:MAG: adenylate/guanylate cyclase domain-containing protein [Labilithrix sp.]|nr:adenylate/guanylate cyclase domain-containing protein [Labilithrix sp.]